MARLREAENEVELLRQEIGALENSASQTESAIDSLLVTMRSGNRNLSSVTRSINIDDEYEIRPSGREPIMGIAAARANNAANYRNNNPVTYLNQHRNVPMVPSNTEPISHRFSDRTITQACTLLLREAGRPLHVNELYNLLIAGGMNFKGNNPTISIAVSLNRNRRFRKVDPGTFDLVMREAERAVS